MTSYRTYTTTICPWIFQARPGRGSAGRGFITQWCGRIWQGNDPTGKQRFAACEVPTAGKQREQRPRARAACSKRAKGQFASSGSRAACAKCAASQALYCAACAKRVTSQTVFRAACAKSATTQQPSRIGTFSCVPRRFVAFVCMCWKTLEKPVTHFPMAVGSSRESGFSPARAVRLPFCASRVSRGSLPAYRGVRGSTAPSASVPGQQRARPRHIVQASSRDDARGSCTSRTSHERRQRGVPCELLARGLHSHAAGRAAVWPQLGASKRAHGAPVGKAHQTDRASTHPGWGRCAGGQRLGIVLFRSRGDAALLSWTDISEKGSGAYCFLPHISGSKSLSRF